MKRKINDIFGFQLPNAVIKSAVKKIEFIEKIPNSDQYGVNRSHLAVDQKFAKYKVEAEKENSLLTTQLLNYASKYYETPINKEELIQEFIAYLVDESNGNKYQEIISAFILQNSENTALVKQLNAIREGSILYMGLNCNINEIGSITHDLTLFLDTEVLFDIYGYNGEVFQSLALDLISLIQDANKAVRRIKLRYFEDTKKEISLFFAKAEEIVRNKSYLKENVAMKAIVNGCKDSTDVSDKEADFFHTLQYKYGILPDERQDYYAHEDYVSNLERSLSIESDDPEIELSLKFLSHINKLRKNQIFYDYTKSQFLFVTQTWKTLDLSNRISIEQANNHCTEDEFSICNLAVSMSFLTNILWYKMNRGFGAQTYPKNLDAVVKAKIVLASFISQNVNDTYDQFRKEYREGKLSAEQMAGRLLGLREKASKPEEITPDNMEENLNFDPAYICRYEEERELQRVKLEEKEEIILQITSSSEKYKAELRKTNDELIATQTASAEKELQLKSKDTIIDEQQQTIEQKNRIIEAYEAKEKKRAGRIRKIKKILQFVVAIFIRVFILTVFIYLSYRFAKYVKADAANTAAIVIGLVGAAITIVDIVKNLFHKIFE